MSKYKIGFYNSKCETKEELEKLECDIIFDNIEDVKKHFRKGDTIVFNSMISLYRAYEIIDILNYETEFKFAKEEQSNIGSKLAITYAIRTFEELRKDEKQKEALKKLLECENIDIIEKERIRIKQRQKEGIEAYKLKNNGKGAGRPAAAIDDNFKIEYDKWKNKEITAVEAINNLSISKSTFYKLVRSIEKES